jgi:DSBA-like thioredoxin domain
MKVEFWFDPVCPFCWLTSRWLDSIATERDLEIEWRPISLLFKNEMQPDNPFYDKASRTRDLLRVVESVRAAGQADRIGDLYREFGRQIHHEKNFNINVVEALKGLGLDPAHAVALDDESFDVAIHTAMDDGLGLVGTDVGTPIIAVEIDGKRLGFFGPVITQFPNPTDALKLWDGYLTLLSVPGFFELKRTRTEMPTLPPLN